MQGVSVLLQVRTICPAEISLRPLLAARAVHLPLSVCLLYTSENGYGIPELQAVLNAAVAGEQQAE